MTALLLGWSMGTWGSYIVFNIVEKYSVSIAMANIVSDHYKSPVCISESVVACILSSSGMRDEVTLCTMVFAGVQQLLVNPENTPGCPDSLTILR